MKFVYVVLLSFILVGAGCSNQERWTGFYYNNASIKEWENYELRTPSRRSELNEFENLQLCENWAMDIRRTRIIENKEDIFYCARFCKKSIWTNGIDCLDDEGILSTFEVDK